MRCLACADPRLRAPLRPATLCHSLSGTGTRRNAVASANTLEHALARVLHWHARSGMRWHAFLHAPTHACVRWHALTSYGIRWHALARAGMRCPARACERCRPLPRAGLLRRAPARSDVRWHALALANTRVPKLAHAATCLHVLACAGTR